MAVCPHAFLPEREQFVSLCSVALCAQAESLILLRGLGIRVRSVFCDEIFTLLTSPTMPASAPPGLLYALSMAATDPKQESNPSKAANCEWGQCWGRGFVTSDV